jgi:hypothetical protein
MALSISTKEENGKWVCHVVCSGSKPTYYYEDTQDKAYEMGLKYLNENYFNLSNDEINAKVALLKKASEK